MQNTFVASRIELKAWGCWRHIPGTGITLKEAKQLISDTKARIKPDDLNMFDWDFTDRDQRNLDIKMMVFLWFKENYHGSQTCPAQCADQNERSRREGHSDLIRKSDPGTRPSPFSSVRCGNTTLPRDTFDSCTHALGRRDKGAGCCPILELWQP